MKLSSHNRLLKRVASNTSVEQLCTVLFFSSAIIYLFNEFAIHAHENSLKEVRV
jgi:hypothetical protein